jgi:mannitol/fructose-specific phosphotransferase system IIA component (Ntr-type)
MRLHDLIDRPSQIVTALAAKDRWQAIDELVAVLVKTARVAPGRADAVAEAVRAREQTMSTGIGHGVGIPHAATEHVERVEAVLGIARHDVDFAALDECPVHIVVLFVVPQNQFQAHLDTLSSIARLFSDEATRERIRAATRPEEVLTILKDHADK